MSTQRKTKTWIAARVMGESNHTLPDELRPTCEAVGDLRLPVSGYSTLAIDEFKVAGVLAVETAARRTKPAVAD
jgi:hypothetical protein